MSQILIGTVKAHDKTEISSDMPYPFKGGERVKDKGIDTFKYYQNRNTITCILTFEDIKAIGIAKCSPKDKFNLSHGVKLSEMRAKQDFYRILAKEQANKKY